MSRLLGLFVACLLAFAADAQEVLIGQNVRLGAKVVVSEAVDGSLHVAGGDVRIEAPVRGNLHVAAGNVRVEAPVTNSVRIAGGHVTINAPVGGDASVAAGRLELGPNARIAGKLKFHGGELVRDAAAQVDGGVTENIRTVRHHREYTIGERFQRGWIWTLGLMVLAAIIAGALPGPSGRMARELRDRPWMTLLLGLIALTSIPVAAVLLMITIIGIPVGILGLLAYALLLFVGYVWLSVVVGGLLLERVRPETAALTAWRMGAAVLTMLVIALLARVPFAGGFVRFAVLACGVGMIVAAVLHRTTPREGVAA